MSSKIHGGCINFSTSSAHISSVKVGQGLGWCKALKKVVKKNGSGCSFWK